MDKERRRAGTGQGGGNLAADMPGLAHAGDHHAPAAGDDYVAGFDKILIDAAFEFSDGFPLNTNGPQGRGAVVPVTGRVCVCHLGWFSCCVLAGSGSPGYRWHRKQLVGKYIIYEPLVLM